MRSASHIPTLGDSPVLRASEVILASFSFAEGDDKCETECRKLGHFDPDSIAVLGEENVMRAKTELLSELRTMLRDVFALRASGQLESRVGRAHGYVDGFMRALLDTGIATKNELLTLVAEERERASGPALRTLEALEDETVAA